MADSGESGAVLEGEGGVVADSAEWTADARDFDRRLRQAIALLDPLMDAPHEKLVAMYRGAPPRGRRTLVTLVNKQISLLGTLRMTLEKIEVEGEGDGTAAAAANGGVAQAG